MAFIKNISSKLSDAELVSLYKTGGSLHTLGELYQRYMELIYGVCLKYLGDSDEAKDCVINIYEELIMKLQKHEVTNFRGWLYQLAKNHCLMKIRSAKNHPRHINHEFMHLADNDHLHEVFEKEARLGIMEYCIEQLAGEQRQVINLFYLQQQCYKNIASYTGLEVNSVRSYIQNGRRNLKICMEKKALENA